MKNLILLVILIISLPVNASIIRNLLEHESLSYFGKSLNDSITKPCLDVLNWNIFKAKRKKKYLYVMKNYYSKHTDLLLIQEASLNDSIKKSFTYFNDFKIDVASTFEFLGKRVGGVATGSKAIAIKKELVFSEGELGFTTSKVSLLTKYKLHAFEKNLVVVNIHAINFVTLNLFKDHIDRTFLKLQEFSDEKSSIIFAGDFNTWNVDRYNYLYSLMSEFGLTPVFGKKDKRTKMPVLSRFIKYFDYHLDHFFVKNLKIKKAQVHKVFASDHRPLFVNLCF